MAKFCGKCGSKLDETTGLCPKCDAEQLKSQAKTPEAAFFDDRKTPDVSPSEKEAKKAAKEKKRAGKKAKRAAMTTGQKVRRFFLKLLAIMLVVAILAIGAVALLVYFGVLDIPNNSNCIYKIFGNTDNRIAANNDDQLTQSDAFSDAAEYNNHYYKVFEDSLSWDDAKAACEKLGGHLAVITSEDEEAFIEALIQPRKRHFYWLGGTDADQEGNWTWISGETWNYTNWDSGEPKNESGIDGNEENYLAIERMKNVWNDAQGEGDPSGDWSIQNAGYICEWDSLQISALPDQSSPGQDTDDSVQIEEVAGAWRIDREKTTAENEKSLQWQFGSAIKYGDLMELNEDQSFKYYFGAGIGGEGTWEIESNYIAYEIRTYDEGIQENGTISVYDAGQTVYLVMDCGGYDVYWSRDEAMRSPDKSNTTNSDASTLSWLIDYYWYQNIQSPSIFAFYSDGTYIEYASGLFTPTETSVLSDSEYYETYRGSYSLDGPTLTLMRNDGVVNVMDAFIWLDDGTVGDLFVQQQLAAYHGNGTYFYETNWADTGMPSDNAFYLVRIGKISEEAPE